VTAETDLPPSSVAAFTEALRGESGSLDAWLEVNDESEVAAHIEAYARANVLHHTAAQAAEIEALRELCGMAYQLAGVHDAPEKWLDALSNAAAGRPFSTDGLLPYWPQAVCEAEARAEQLAEALREAKELIEELTGDSNYERWDDLLREQEDNVAA
jgi:hypothetical protein